MEQYDLCVIGAGPSGYAAAMRAIDLGKRVLLVEKGKLGGAGLHDGALSSKTLWELAKDLASARNQARRYGSSEPVVPFSVLQNEVAGVVEKRRSQLEIHLHKLMDRGLTFLRGQARLLSKTSAEVLTADGAVTIQAANFVLATGSVPRKLDSLPIDEKTVLTSDGISGLQDYPESMVILGAGVIGCEFATIFSLLGRTRVYLIDKAERILPFEDEDVVRVVEQSLEKNGVTIHHNARLARMEIVDGQVEYELHYNDGRREVLHVEKALVAIGRVPNTENLGLDAAGVKVTGRGHVFEPDKNTTTSADNIFAVGDITRDIALVNVGEMEGRYAVESIFREEHPELCYDNISTIMFLHPEVAGVGLNETQARAAGIPYRMACVNYSTIPRAMAMRSTLGFFKILVSDDDEMRLLGMRAIGRQASSAIQAVAVLISMGKGVRSLAECIHPHPSIVEGVQECVRMLLKKSILKPGTLGEELRCGRYCEGCWEPLS
jgi:dihydrolipoamide dehydrogenase